MKQTIIDIDWTERNFAAAARDERIACVATGATLEDVQHELNVLWIQTIVYFCISYLVYKRTYGKQLWA